MRWNEPERNFEIIGIYADTAATLAETDSYKEAVFMVMAYQYHLGESWEIYFTES